MPAVKFKKIFTYAVFLLISYGLIDNLLGLAYEKLTGQPLVTDLSRSPHPIYHHGFAPLVSNSLSEFAGRIYRINTNSLGFKDLEARNVDLQSSKRRILIIGDSFTEGIGLPFEKTFAGIFAAAAQKNNVEVLNAAVAGYSPTVYYYKLKYLLENVNLRFSEVMLFLDISDLQDERIYFFVKDDAVHTYTMDDTFNYFLNRILKRILPVTYSAVKKIYPVKLMYKNEENYSKEYLNLERTSWTFDENVWQTTAQKSIPLVESRLNDIAHLLKAAKVKLTLVVYPWKHQIIHGDLNSRQVTIWKPWAEKNGVDFINVFPDFINGDESASTKYFLDGDVHWNEAGHELVAKRLINIYFPDNK